MLLVNCGLALFGLMLHLLAVSLMGNMFVNCGNVDRILVIFYGGRFFPFLLLVFVSEMFVATAFSQTGT